MSESIETTEQWPEDISGRGEMVDQVHPHAEQTDEDIGHGQVGQVQVDRHAQRSLGGHRKHHGGVAEKGRRYCNDVE